MRTVMNAENSATEGEAARSPFTPIEESRIKHLAVQAAATRGGIITIRGWEMQPKTSAEEPRRSAMVEGLLWQISEEVTRRAQVLSYHERGLTKREIIRAVWKVEEGPSYESACAAYEEIVGSQGKKT
jgi:hypothetical protein